MKVFRVAGEFQMGRLRRQKFVKEVAAEDEARAREVLFSELGSKHGTPRRRIAIASVEEVPPDKVESSVARAKAGILS
jgi:ribosomal protein L20A (L18A)